MSNKLWGALLVCGSVWTGQAAAVNPDNFDIPYAGAFGSVVIPDSVRDNDPGLGFGLFLGMPLASRPGEALEAHFFANNLERETDGKNNYQTGLTLDWVKDFGLYGWPADNTWLNWAPDFMPFVLGGLGAIEDDANGDKHIVAAIEGGGGFLVPLPYWGMAVRAEARLVSQINNDSVPDHDFLLDYRLNLGVQIPLTPFFDRGVPVAPAAECDVAVVDPTTGRSDCATDSDRDGVADGVDKCPGTAPGTAVDATGCGSTIGDSDRDGVADESDKCAYTQPGMKVDASGCAIAQTLVITEVRFKLDSAELTSDAQVTLENVAMTLDNQKNINAEINGYADNQGSEAYNLALSNQRAEAVRNYLVGKGVEAGRLTTKGFGSDQPVVANDSPAGREVNRRVEFKIIIK
jgi:outer membrane protein OmpA-like peptidoglycan-associated protein